MNFVELNEIEIEAVSGGPLPLLLVGAVKAFSAGAALAAVVLAAEDLTNAPGHNHYGK